jgi:hypothetical protein
MTYTPKTANAGDANKSTVVERMREDQEEWRREMRVRRLALSDQAMQKAANAVPLAQRRPWLGQQLGRRGAG